MSVQKTRSRLYRAYTHKDGLKPDEEEVRAVKDMKAPENVKELQTSLGFIKYLQKFLPCIADISEPLCTLLQKKVE